MTDKKPGAEPDRLKIDREDWEDAMADAMKKPRPDGGWPDTDDESEDERDRDDERD